MFRVSSLEEQSVLVEYLNEIGRNFCPFSKPSTQKEILLFSTYELASDTMERAQAEAFYIGLVHTELFRRFRRSQASVHERMLACENVVITSPFAEDQGGTLLGWPHWLLKALYTRMGVVFGKFWKGEQSSSHDGRTIPPPPFTFLSIRSAVKKVDARFFSRAPQLLDEYAQADDTGESVLAVVNDTSALVERIVTKALEVATKQNCIEAVDQLLATNFFEQLREEKYRRT